MRRALLMATAVLVAAVAAPVGAVGAVERIDFTATMSDGVVLEASLYVPADAPEDADLPLIVRQHGGGSNKDNPYDTMYASKAVETENFAALLYSHRGHGGSGGLFDFFGARTTLDFSEMLDEVERREGGRIDTDTVGVSGYSQGGGESLLPAAADARVKAAAVGQTFADLNHALNPEDCFKFSFATGIFLAAYKSTASRTRDDLAIRWGAHLYSDTEDVGVPGALPSTTEDLASRSPQTYLEQLDIPIFWTQAWEDQLFPGDHPERILEPLRQRGQDVHYWFSSGGHAAGPNFPDDEIAREQAMLEWFDEFLRGVDHGFASGARPAVDYWRRAAPGKPGTWVHETAEAWPVPDAEPLQLYPEADGMLAWDAPGSSEQLAGRIANTFGSANLANDAITNEIAGNLPGMGDLVRSIPEDPSPVATATWTSMPLEEAVTFVGAPTLELRHQTANTRVFQIAAKVWDVSDAGARLVSRGCRSFESDPHAPEPPTGYGPSTSSLALWPNAHRFEPGHRIVLTVSAADFPTFKPDTDPAATAIYTGSRLTLPVR